MTARGWWTLGIGLVIVLGSAAAWVVTGGEPPQTVQASQATAKVTKGAITSEIRAGGNIEPAARETIPVATVGEVEEVFFQDGDKVAKGDVLLTFVQEDLAEQLDQAEQSLESRLSELEELEDQYKQASDEDRRTEIGLNLEKKKLSITQLQKEIASLQEEEALAPIAAPIDGTLRGFDMVAGEVMTRETNLGEVVEYDRLHLVVGIDELDIVKIAEGQAAEILVEAVPESLYTGVVTEISTEGRANNGVASFEVTLLLDRIEGLKSGLSAEASIVTASKEDVLYVPVDAVQVTEGQYYVQAPANESADSGTRLDVEIGIVNEDYAEIVAGLEEGDEVWLPSTVSAQDGT